MGEEKKVEGEGVVEFEWSQVDEAGDVNDGQEGAARRVMRRRRQRHGIRWMPNGILPLPKSAKTRVRFGFTAFLACAA